MRKIKKALYISIADDIRRQVALGLLKKGDRLPSCRESALEHGINPNTVQRAYAELEAEGVIFTVPKKGVYVGGESGVLTAAGEKIAELKDAGVSRDELIEIINKVYPIPTP